MLTSQGIPFYQLQSAGLHALLVDEAWVAHAVRELSRYEEENRGFGRRLPLPRAAPLWRTGAVLFAVVLIAVSAQEAFGPGGETWRGAGLASGAAIRAGEYWRALTALTLHADLAHLAANLFFGLLFGSLVAHGHGGGLGWLAIVLAGALGNVANAWLLAPEHSSLGASTAVFGAVGILCGSEARSRHLLRDTPMRRVAPVTVALVFLAYLGMGEGQLGRSIDVSAHLLGLVAGLGIGPFLPGLLARGFLEVRMQVLTGAFTLALLAAAWTRALLA